MNKAEMAFQIPLPLIVPRTLFLHPEVSTMPPFHRVEVTPIPELQNEFREEFLRRKKVLYFPCVSKNERRIVSNVPRWKPALVT